MWHQQSISASTVFDTIWCYGNFVIAGDSLTLPSEEDAVHRITALRLNNRPVLDTSHPGVAAEIRKKLNRFEPYSEVEKKAGQPLEIITDQNMLTEYKYGKSIFKEDI